MRDDRARRAAGVGAQRLLRAGAAEGGDGRHAQGRGRPGPSGIEIPGTGCWTFDLRWAGQIGQVATCVPVRRSGMIGPVKGRIPAVLAALAFFASAGTADAQFTVEGTYATGNTPRSVYAADFNARRPAGRRGVQPGRQLAVGVPARRRRLHGGGRLAVRRPGRDEQRHRRRLQRRRPARPRDRRLQLRQRAGRRPAAATRPAASRSETAIPIGRGNPASAVAAGDFNLRRRRRPRDRRLERRGNVTVYLRTRAPASRRAQPELRRRHEPPPDRGRRLRRGRRRPTSRSLNAGSANVIGAAEHRRRRRSPHEGARRGRRAAQRHRRRRLRRRRPDRSRGREQRRQHRLDPVAHAARRLHLAPAPSRSATARSPSRPRDFDGNGTLDIAVAVNGGSLDVIRRGAAACARHHDADPRPPATGVAVADFNADGRTDAAVTSLART